MKKKLLSFALALSMLLGAGALLPENAFTESTSISASADESWKCIATGEHKWTTEEHEAPTCDKEGYTIYKCRRCGKTKKETIPQIDEHDFFAWEVEIEPTDHLNILYKGCLHGSLFCFASGKQRAVNILTNLLICAKL